MKKKISARLWFLLAFVLFLAPVMICSFAFNSSVEKNEILHTNQMKWEQFTKAAFSIANMFSRCSVAIEDTTSLQECFYSEKGEISVFESRLSLLLERIETRINGIECICSVRGNTDIYTSQGRMSFRGYEESKSTYDLTKSRFCSRIHATTVDHLRMIYSVDDSINNALVLFVPVSIRPVANHDVIFVFWMDASEITAFLNEYMGDTTGNFYLYSQQKVECFFSQGSLPLLKNVSLQLEKRKIHGIIGRNGSGKTVLMKCICGFLRPTSGAVKVFDKIIGTDCDFAPDTGMLIETPGFLIHETGMNNLKWLAKLGKGANRERISELIRMVGLDPAMKKKVGQYSLGMRQRLGIAQALLDDPALLM